MTTTRRVRLDPPWFLVDDDAFRACFVVGLDQDPDTACNVDVEVVLPDGSRWAATLVTLAEVQRLMARWHDGRYFWCPETLIVRDPGVTSMTAVIAGLLDTTDTTDTTDFAGIFRRLPD